MERKDTRKSQLIAITVFLAAAFLLTVLPLILIAKYDHPSADDFSYGLQTSQAWAGTGSVIRVLAAAAQTVHDTYFSWQGSFSGVFMMAVQPAVFWENLYFLTPLFVLSLFLFGTLFLGKTVLMDYLKADRVSFLVICLTTAAMSVNFLPSAVEGIYWYNGAVYYTGFYSLSLIMFGLQLRLFQAESRKALTADSVLLILCAFLVGGGNYSTALTAALVLTIFTVLGFMRRKKARAALSAAAVLSSFAALAVSAAAPGNAVRKSDFANTPTALNAVLDSLKTALADLGRWTTLPVVVCLIFSLPLIYSIVRNSSYSFRNPILVLLLSFCVFAAQLTPPFYALGNSGPARLLDIVYYSYYLFLLINLFYLTGWVCRWLHGKSGTAERGISFAFTQTAEKYPLLLFVCFAVLLSAACAGTNRPGSITSVSAAVSMRTGEAAKYDDEAVQREKEYKASNRGNVVVDKFSVRPYVLYFSDIESNPANWRNEAVAKYYHLKSVVRKP